MAYADNTFLPLRRRLLSTWRPFLVLMRLRKPWTFWRLRLFGWYVLFIYFHLHLTMTRSISTYFDSITKKASLCQQKSEKSKQHVCKLLKAKNWNWESNEWNIVRFYKTWGCELSLKWERKITWRREVTQVLKRKDILKVVSKLAPIRWLILSKQIS